MTRISPDLGPNAEPDLQVMVDGLADLDDDAVYVDGLGWLARDEADREGVPFLTIHQVRELLDASK